MEELLTIQDLSEIFKVPPKCVYNLGYRGCLPQPIKVGRLLRWRRSDVDLWIKEQKVAPAHEVRRW